MAVRQTATVGTIQTATGATSNTLVDTLQSYVVNTHQTKTVFVTAGTGAGQSRLIIANDATTLTVFPDWTVTPAAGDTFDIRTTGAANVMSGPKVTVLPGLPATGGPSTSGDWGVAGWYQNLRGSPFWITGSTSGTTLSATGEFALLLEAPALEGLTATNRAPFMLSMVGRDTAQTSIAPADPVCVGVETTKTGLLATSPFNNSTINVATTQGQASSAHVDKLLTITSGTGAGQTRTVVSNTATAMTITPIWTTNPDTTSVFSIAANIPGTASAGTSLTMTVPTVTAAAHVNKLLTITGGTGAGQTRIIASNTATDLTIRSDNPWVTIPDATSTFTISLSDNFTIPGALIPGLTTSPSGARCDASFILQDGTWGIQGRVFILAQKQAITPSSAGVTAWASGAVYYPGSYVSNGGKVYWVANETSAANTQTPAIDGAYYYPVTTTISVWVAREGEAPRRMIYEPVNTAFGQIVTARLRLMGALEGMGHMNAAFERAALWTGWSYTPQQIMDLACGDDFKTTALAQFPQGRIRFTANPAAASTVTINGVVWTFVASGATGNQTNIQATLALTMTQLAADLNASVNASITPATYYEHDGNLLSVIHDTAGASGEAFTLAASAGIVTGANLGIMESQVYLPNKAASPVADLRGTNYTLAGSATWTDIADFKPTPTGSEVLPVLYGDGQAYAYTIAADGTVTPVSNMTQLWRYRGAFPSTFYARLIADSNEATLGTYGGAGFATDLGSGQMTTPLTLTAAYQVPVGSRDNVTWPTTRAGVSGSTSMASNPWAVMYAGPVSAVVYAASRMTHLQGSVLTDFATNLPLHYSAILAADWNHGNVSVFRCQTARVTKGFSHMQRWRTPFGVDNIEGGAPQGLLRAGRQAAATLGGPVCMGQSMAFSGSDLDGSMVPRFSTSNNRTRNYWEMRYAYRALSDQGARANVMMFDGGKAETGAPIAGSTSGICQFVTQSQNLFTLWDAHPFFTHPAGAGLCKIGLNTYAPKGCPNGFPFNNAGGAAAADTERMIRLNHTIANPASASSSMLWSASQQWGLSTGERDFYLALSATDKARRFVATHDVDALPSMVKDDVHSNGPFYLLKATRMAYGIAKAMQGNMSAGRGVPMSLNWTAATGAAVITPTHIAGTGLTARDTNAVTVNVNPPDQAALFTTYLANLTARPYNALTDPTPFGIAIFTDSTRATPVTGWTATLNADSVVITGLSPGPAPAVFMYSGSPGTTTSGDSLRKFYGDMETLVESGSALVAGVPMAAAFGLDPIPLAGGGGGGGGSGGKATRLGINLSLAL